MSGVCFLVGCLFPCRVLVSLSGESMTCAHPHPTHPDLVARRRHGTFPSHQAPPIAPRDKIPRVGKPLTPTGSPISQMFISHRRRASCSIDRPPITRRCTPWSSTMRSFNVMFVAIAVLHCHCAQRLSPKSLRLEGKSGSPSNTADNVERLERGPDVVACAMKHSLGLKWWSGGYYHRARLKAIGARGQRGLLTNLSRLFRLFIWMFF